MLISELDGFLAGILVCPDLIMPGEYRRWCEAAAMKTPRRFSKIPGRWESRHLVMKHCNATANDLRRGRYAPVFDVDTRWSPLGAEMMRRC